ncbi:MAG: hypothetical protein ISR99_01235 [Parcubacteria group bacterium]|nr:hypothetical protein [Parcubacteria group bacterium]
MDFNFLNVEYFLLLIYQLIFGQDILTNTIPDSVFVLWDIFRVVSTVLTLLLLTAVVYVAIRLRQIRKDEEQVFMDAADERKKREEGLAQSSLTGTLNASEKWEQIVSHIGSENPNDWRLAIIEADVLLEQILTRAGYQGETLGDQLKNVARGDFASLDSAWEAHRVRNKIAHEGTSYEITNDEAKRVIGLYRRVFKELEYIN